jgi:hypothetical protein
MAWPGRISALGASRNAQVRSHHRDPSVFFKCKRLHRAITASSGQNRGARKRFAAADSNLKASPGFTNEDLAILDGEHLIVATACLAGMCLQGIVKFQMVAPATEVEAIEFGLIQSIDKPHLNERFGGCDSGQQRGKNEGQECLRFGIFHIDYSSTSRTPNSRHELIQLIKAWLKTSGRSR